jgi:hypothetical protein
MIYCIWWSEEKFTAWPDYGRLEWDKRQMIRLFEKKIHAKL